MLRARCALARLCGLWVIYNLFFCVGVRKMIESRCVNLSRGGVRLSGTGAAAVSVTHSQAVKALTVWNLELLQLQMRCNAVSRNTFLSILCVCMCFSPPYLFHSRSETCCKPGKLFLWFKKKIQKVGTLCKNSEFCFIYIMYIMYKIFNFIFIFYFILFYITYFVFFFYLYFTRWHMMLFLFIFSLVFIYIAYFIFYFIFTFYFNLYYAFLYYIIYNILFILHILYCFMFIFYTVTILFYLYFTFYMFLFILCIFYFNIIFLIILCILHCFYLCLPQRQMILFLFIFYLYYIFYILFYIYCIYLYIMFI